MCPGEKCFLLLFWVILGIFLPLWINFLHFAPLLSVIERPTRAVPLPKRGS